MEPNTQESIISLPKELQEIWNLSNQEPNILSFGKLLLSILETIFKLENQSILRNLELSLIMSRLSYLKLHRETLAQKLIFLLKDRKEKIFIISNQFSLLILYFNITSLGIQEKKKFHHLSASTLFIKKDSDVFMLIQSQLLLQHALE